MSDFGKNPDGTKRKFGQLSKEEQRTVLKEACAKLQAEFEQPPVKRALAKVLKDTH